MTKQHWMIRSVRVMTIFFVLLGCFIVFWYSPFYSNIVVRALNALVPVEVDQVAAQSQQMAALSESEGLEPGSAAWIARQAYLRVMEEAIHSANTQDLTLIQARYKLLKAELEEQQLEESDKKEEKPQIPLLPKYEESNSPASEPKTQKVALDKNADDESGASEVLQDSPFLLNQYDTEENKALMDKFLAFLRTHPIKEENKEAIDKEIYQDIALIQNQSNEKKKSNSEPYAIVILGGGLTLAENKSDIVVNDYTRLRLEKTLEIEKQTRLPIVLSGVEASYMQAWLKKRGVEAKLLEDRSMNTCENTRFSSLLLQKKGGAPTVLLITDRYHMPRTRRLFALNGIETIPVEAPMPTQLTPWQPSKSNYDHSRRANYEMLATIRDVLFGSSGCREVP
ncbi:YdcF family protein [Acinetobacter sp. 194]|uniref:YdcF family protein n=1 Tax=Acinetobacter shaoyimingii TaxID=2715164 RepID=UPI001407F6EF|nr:YdcF family protein [Acinetobacter shaoyimingii]NHB58605.1 YdcF family protein [Acinetobacter shaoyimingii]